MNVVILKMSSTTEQQRIILVTGANKGIGFEVVKKLIKQSSFNNNDVILLGSRDLKRGQNALQQLGFPLNVHLLELDTSSKKSIIHVTNEIKEKYGGQLDVIINNAGIALKDNTVESVREMMDTNFYGVKILNEHLIPFLRKNGRVANVASGIGPAVLHYVSKDLQDKYTSSALTIDQLDHLVQHFISAFESNKLKEAGYPNDFPYLAYGISKAALIALTRIEAHQYSGIKNIFICSVGPGYCATDLSNNSPDARSPELGADSILYVVNTPDSELENGAFYQYNQKLPQVCMDEAKVQAVIQITTKLSNGK